MTEDTERSRVLIAGGGVAGLEALFALSALAKDLVEVEVISPGDEFVFRPMLVAEPFGAAEALRLEHEQTIAEAGGTHLKDALASVDPAARTITTRSGKTLPYDALIIATGATPIEAVPGAVTFGITAQRRQFETMLRGLGRRGARRLVFIVPRGVGWTIAAYELALLTAAERDVRNLPDVELMLVTHESAPLEAFGVGASELVSSRLDEARVALKTGAVAERVERGRLVLSASEAIEAGGFVALPELQVPAIPGIPQRPRGFIQTDSRAQVVGLESVWAAGDATWFPIKQGGLAAQQADAAARSIAAAAGAHVPVEPFQPVLRAALVTGDAPEFLRSYLPRRGAAEASAGQALWWPPTKVAGRYLGPYIAGKLEEGPAAQELVDLRPPADATDVATEHELAVGILLAAADADAATGDYEGALKWLRLVEQLEFVVPARYIARRYEWRRHLHPDLSPDTAAVRIDPSFESGEAAMRDLDRRFGWLRELGDRTELEMREHLSQLDAGIEQLRALTRRAGIVKRGE